MKKRETAIIVHVSDRSLRNDSIDLHEYSELAYSAGLYVKYAIIIKLKKRDARCYIGKGHIEHIIDAAKHNCVSCIVFNIDLSATQQRNLVTIIDLPVIDYTELILDIFAKRAHTFEGKLQVELAQLTHLSTRLVRGWTHLERQKGGIGLRGPGEKQLETDRRLIRDRIKKIRKNLKIVSSNREQNRLSRKSKNIPIISLIGYTNSGKSTLFNRLTKSSTYTEDILFATLDPLARIIYLPGIGNAILIDSVGFMHNLPNTLIEAFNATLEEITQSTLLLHINDITAINNQDRIKDTNKILDNIHADKINTLLVYNKIDLYHPQNYIPNTTQPKQPIYISATSGEGIDDLIRTITEIIKKDYIQTSITIKQSKIEIIEKLYQLNVVTSCKNSDDNNIKLNLNLPVSLYKKLKKQKIL